MVEQADSVLERAKAGDMGAFAEIFEALRADAHRVACRIVGDDLAQDVVMEAFLKAWQALPRFDGRSSVKTWLYRIVYNAAVDTLRSRRRETSFSDLEGDGHPMPEPADGTGPGPDESAAEAETVVRVREGLKGLTEPHRIVLLLRYADGLSYSEIAAATGVSIGTVMSRIFHAKRRLRRVLKERD